MNIYENIKSNLKEYTTDQYNNRLFTYDEATHYLDKFCKTVNEKFKDYDYEFDWRIEGDNLVVFDRCEYFDYEDPNFYAVDKIAKDIFGKDAYLEPENKVVMIVAGAYLQEKEVKETEVLEEATDADYKLRIVLTDDRGTNCAPSNIVVNKEGTNEARNYLYTLVKNCNSAEELAKTLNENRFPDFGDKRIFNEWKPISTESNVQEKYWTNAFLNQFDDIEFAKILIVDSHDCWGNHQILKVKKDGKVLNK